MLVIRQFWTFLKDIWKDKHVLWGLAKNDFKARFAASFLGGAWGFIQPLITLLVMWFVFQVGFRNPPVSGVPFIAWLAPAYLIWVFFSETLVSGTNCLVEYSYLVKKVNFRVSMLPLVKIISSMFVHAAFILFIFFLMLCNKVTFSVYNVQVLYYWLCACFLLCGLCWLLAALAPYVKDVVNIVSVFVQIGFWATPIFWTPDNMSPIVQTVLKMNPMFYICRGYRDAFIDHVWFWQRGYTNLFFWAFAILCFGMGAFLFHKLRPQFADVL
jgi:ABC-type polysaccharide/polyol phosphate export permease